MDYPDHEWGNASIHSSTYTHPTQSQHLLPFLKVGKEGTYMKSTVLWSKIVSALSVTTSWMLFVSRHPSEEGRTHLHSGHDTLHALRVQLQHTVKDADLVISQRLFACAVELERKEKWLVFPKT